MACLQGAVLLTRTKPPPTQRGSERVAQVVEHVTFNHGVEGSSPSALTNEIKHNLHFSQRGHRLRGSRQGHKIVSRFGKILSKTAAFSVLDLTARSKALARLRP